MRFPLSLHPPFFKFKLLRSLPLKRYSSSTPSPTPKPKPGWSANTSLIITNPILLIMENCTTMFQLKQIQAQMTRTGLFFHLFPVSRLLTFCALAETGDIHYAHRIFSQISKPNIYIWNTMIRGYCKAKFPELGLSLFCEMVRGDVEMDHNSFVFGLKVCGTLFEGMLIHCRAWNMGFASDLVVNNELIHFYADRGGLSDAKKLFDESSVRDVVSWTAMIDGYSKRGYADEALKLFDEMVAVGVKTNEVTMITVLSACSKKGDLSLGKSLHGYVTKNSFNCGLNLQNAILDMYVKCGCLKSARELFEKMETKDVFSWTSMVNGGARLGDLGLARKYFDEMPEKNVVSWSAMIAGYSQNDRPDEALALFLEMEDAGLLPVESTLVCVLSACGQSGCLDLGRSIHLYYLNPKRVKHSVTLANAIMDMYAKCGSIDAAAKVFNEMPRKDLVSWNSMITAYASHGLAEQAIILFEEMKSVGFMPDDITLVGVLSACAHGGLVNEGREIFRNIEKVYRIEPKLEHYACMVDLLGRVGFLEEAYELMNHMPMEPDKAAWGALLHACWLHKNVELGKLAAEKLLPLDPKDSGIYMLLASICANKNRWDDVRMVRSMMREQGVKKTPGCSSIEVEGKFHEFLAADVSHPQSEEIYEVLKKFLLLAEMEENEKNISKVVNHHDHGTASL